MIRGGIFAIKRLTIKTSPAAIVSLADRAGCVARRVAGSVLGMVSAVAAGEATARMTCIARAMRADPQRVPGLASESEGDDLEPDEEAARHLIGEQRLHKRARRFFRVDDRHADEVGACLLYDMPG
jgi:hypothetical protein